MPNILHKRQGKNVLWRVEIYSGIYYTVLPKAGRCGRESEFSGNLFHFFEDPRACVDIHLNDGKFTIIEISNNLRGN